MENPWLAWYPGEYIGKTRSLTMAQHGAYMLLLWEYYINGPFVANATGLLNVCCGKSEADEVDMDYVLERFFTLEDGFWHHKRADEEIEKRATIRHKRKLVGKMGGEANASRLLKQNSRQSQSQSQSQEPKVKGRAPLANEKQLLDTPADLHPMQYAAHICDELVIPKKGNMETIAGAVETLAKSRKSNPSEAHDYLLAKALAAKEAGDTINMFWFRDGKYNITKAIYDGNKKSAGHGIDRGNHPPEPGTQAKRAFNNFAAVAAVVGGSDRVPEKQRSSGVADRRLTDGTRQTP